MQHQVRLQRPGLNARPFAPRPDRDLALEAAYRRRRPPWLQPKTSPVAAEQPVDAGCADFHQLRAKLARQLQFAMPFQGIDQVRHDRYEELAAHPIPHLPDSHQRFRNFRTISPGPPTPARRRPTLAVQQPDRRLPVHPRRLAKLVEDPLLLVPSRSSISTSYCLRILDHALTCHDPSSPVPFGNTTYEASPTRPVTFPLRQIGTLTTEIHVTKLRAG